MHLEASTNGGASWTRLYTFENGNDKKQQQKSIGLSAYNTTNAQIRFYVEGNGKGSIYVDNIAVTY